MKFWVIQLSLYLIVLSYSPALLTIVHYTGCSSTLAIKVLPMSFMLLLWLQSTPLHLACGYNRVSVVRLLLKQGADVHAKDKG